MGSMCSAEPIDFENWVPEPINFSGFINTGSAEQTGVKFWLGKGVYAKFWNPSIEIPNEATAKVRNWTCATQIEN